MAAVQPAADDPFPSWFDSLEHRHLADLEFAEVRRALQALTRWYVEKRETRRGSRPGAALDGRGKRAAFALFYGPLHFLVVRHIVSELGAASSPLSSILELGCGTGVGAAAWALQFDRRPALSGVDTNDWAVTEARWNWRQLGLVGKTTRGDLARVRLPGREGGVLVAYVANELNAEPREAMLGRLLDAAGRGARILVVEPIARSIVPWWDSWARAFEQRGGRADTWRFRPTLPERLRLLDKAAGLDHGELTGRSLFLDGAASTKKTRPPGETGSFESGSLRRYQRKATPALANSGSTSTS